MDKIATNNYIVALRKEVKNAKNMVAGNLIRKINKLKQEKEKTEDEAQQKKLDDKIENIYSETKLIKTLDVYPICKKVTLKPDTKYWNNVIGDTKSTAEDRLSARIICKNNVQKRVANFRNDHKDCDEWLEEYFEFREKKKELEMVPKKARREQRPSDRADGDELNESHGHRNNRHTFTNKGARQYREKSSNFNDESDTSKKVQESEQLHPSWASKKREKELLKAALSGQVQQGRRIVLNSES